MRIKLKKPTYIGHTATRVHVYPIYPSKNNTDEEYQEKEAEHASDDAIITCAVDLNMDAVEALEHNDAVIVPEEAVEVKELEETIDGKNECTEALESLASIVDSGADVLEVPSPKKRGGRKKKNTSTGC